MFDIFDAMEQYDKEYTKQTEPKSDISNEADTTDVTSAVVEPNHIVPTKDDTIALLTDEISKLKETIESLKGVKENDSQSDLCNNQQS